MSQDSSQSAQHETTPAGDSGDGSWKSDAIDDALDRLRREIDSEKHSSSGPKRKALEKGDELLDDVEAALKKRVD